MMMMMMMMVMMMPFDLYCLKLSPILLLCMSVLKSFAFEDTFAYISVLPQLIFFASIMSPRLHVWVQCQLSYCELIKRWFQSGVTGSRKGSIFCLCSL